MPIETNNVVELEPICCGTRAEHHSGCECGEVLGYWLQPEDKATVQSLSDRIDELEGICAEMLAFADSGASFSYPLGSLQKLREVRRG